MTRKTLAVIAVQAAVLTWLAAILPTWQDEEFTLATTAHGIAYAINRAITYELQAPLYFAVIAAIRSVANTVFVTREFSVVMQLATTAVLARIARRVWPERDPWIFAALVACNPFTVFAALEIRTYAFSLLECAALVELFMAGYFFGSSARARVGLIACALAGLYTQYFIAFDIAGLALVLIVARRFKALRAYLASCTIAVIAFIPLALFIRSQAGGGLSVEPTRIAGFGGELLHPVNLIFSHDYGNEGASTILWTLARLALLAAIAIGRPRFRAVHYAVMALFVAVDLIYVLLNDVAKINLVVPRHYVALFVPEAILAYAIVASFTARAASRAAAAIAAIVAVSYAAALVHTYGAGAKLGDAARIGAFLSHNARAGDAIAVYPGDDVPPVERYYHGTLAIHGYPTPLDERVYHVDAALVRSRAEASAAFDRLPPARRLWFAVQGDCTAANVHGCVTVRETIAARFNVVLERPFFESTLFELEPKSR